LNAGVEDAQGIPNLVLDDVTVVDPTTGELVPHDGATLARFCFRAMW